VGIGLYQCRKIVEAHRGVLTVESEPGKGSRFLVRLPACREGDGLSKAPLSNTREEDEQLTAGRAF
jgi:light-regulated signal transduction histidine kinase (bacteriophytochrome)